MATDSEGQLRHFAPNEVLKGIRSGLVIELASLKNSSLEQLARPFAAMSYGDRTTLAAYGVILMDPPGLHPRRVTDISELALEVVALCARIVEAVASKHLDEVRRAIDAL